jgi:hypothetical protein
MAKEDSSGCGTKKVTTNDLFKIVLKGSSWLRAKKMKDKVMYQFWGNKEKDGK